MKLINARVVSQEQSGDGTQYLSAFGAGIGPSVCNSPKVQWSPDNNPATPDTLTLSNPIPGEVFLHHAAGQLQEIGVGGGATGTNAVRMQSYTPAKRPTCPRRVGIDYGPFSIINTQPAAVLSVDCPAASQMFVRGGGYAWFPPMCLLYSSSPDVPPVSARVFFCPRRKPSKSVARARLRYLSIHSQAVQGLSLKSTLRD